MEPKRRGELTGLDDSLQMSKMRQILTSSMVQYDICEQKDIMVTSKGSQTKTYGAPPSGGTSLLSAQHSPEVSYGGNSPGAGAGKLVHTPSPLTYHPRSLQRVGLGVGLLVGDGGVGGEGPQMFKFGQSIILSGFMFFSSR